MATIKRVDFERLLVIYMDYVGEQEGVDYMNGARPPWIDEGDWTELKRVSQKPSIEDSRPPKLEMD